MPVKLKILIIKYLIFLNNMKNKNSDIMLYIIIKYKQNIYISVIFSYKVVRNITTIL